MRTVRYADGYEKGYKDALERLAAHILMYDPSQQEILAEIDVLIQEMKL